jgi:cholinesterase
MRSRLCALIIMLTFVGHAKAASYRALYVFGDSYSDIGARYLDGNGPTAVAYLAQRMGIAITYPRDPRAASESLDFAASGAISGKEATRNSTGLRWCCQGMVDQVEDFASRVRSGSLSFNPETTLFFLAGGLNDKNIPTETTVDNLTRQISLLKQVGARHVTLALLPTKIPSFSAVADRLNPAYERLAPKLRAELGIDIQLNHWGLYFDQVMQNPGRYGIINTTSKCAGRALFGEDATPCATPDAYFYFHDGHPSTAVHRIVGDKLYQEISASQKVQ